MRPRRLAMKLARIRKALDLSQSGIIRALGSGRGLTAQYISKFERGITEPPLPVLLRYARIAGVLVEVLIDDKLDLPDKLPSEPEHREGIHRSSKSQKGNSKE